jgi:hypothetical protein
MSATQRTRQNSLWLYPGELFIRGVHREAHEPSSTSATACQLYGATWTFSEQPQRDSNPCLHLERWATPVCPRLPESARPAQVGRGFRRVTSRLGPSSGLLVHLLVRRRPHIRIRVRKRLGRRSGFGRGTQH